MTADLYTYIYTHRHTYTCTHGRATRTHTYTYECTYPQTQKSLPIADAARCSFLVSQCRVSLFLRLSLSHKMGRDAYPFLTVEGTYAPLCVSHFAQRTNGRPSGNGRQFSDRRHGTPRIHLDPPVRSIDVTLRKRSHVRSHAITIVLPPVSHVHVSAAPLLNRRAKFQTSFLEIPAGTLSVWKRASSRTVKPDDIFCLEMRVRDFTSVCRFL